jgi:choline/glycine/proline betaine transport protein
MKYTFYIGVFTPGQFMLVGYHSAFYLFPWPATSSDRFYPYLEIELRKIGDAIDIFAVIATLFGLATLGMGVQQIAAGLNHLWNR